MYNSKMLAFLFAISALLFVHTVRTAASKKCDGIPISEMIMFKYKSDLSNKNIEIRMGFKPVLRNETEKVFVGYIGTETKDIHLPPDKCITIKIHKWAEVGYENAIKISDEINEEQANGFAHINTMIDHGKARFPFHYRDNFIAIYEMGQEIFEREFYFGKTYQKMSKQRIMNLIKEIVIPLVELHQVAIHMDFNPKNLVMFFSSEKWKLPRISFLTKNVPTIKLIGLEEALFFGTGRNSGKITENEIANHHQFSRSASAQYVSPEYLDRKITTKLDIWSAGIVILEVILANEYNPTTILEKTFPDEKMKVIKKKVGNIAEFYRGFLIRANPLKVEKPGKFEETTSKEYENFVQLIREENYKVPDVGTDLWWTRYGEVLHDILKIWCNKDLLEFAFLLTNMLDINPEKRMSATAIIDFLNGGCAPNIGIGNEEKMPIFGKVDADFLSISLRAEIYRVKGIYEENKKIRLENLEKIQALLTTVTKRQKLLFSMLAKRKHICEGQKN